MKRQLITVLLVALTGLFAGCRTTDENESATGEMTREMAAQMKALRAQMVASGATAQQLREFDRQTAQLKKSMGQMERTMDRQMRAMEH